MGLEIELSDKALTQYTWGPRLNLQHHQNYKNNISLDSNNMMFSLFFRQLRSHI
jgi:hypothetical protein